MRAGMYGLLQRGSTSMKGWMRRFGAIALVVLSLLSTGAGLAIAAQPPSTPRETAAAQTEHRAAGEANLVLPDLGQTDVGGYNGRTLLMGGLGVCVLGMVFGLV